MHTTDELPVRDVDVAMGHHWTSTSPVSHFRSTFMLARHDVADDGTPTQTTVTLDGVTERRAGAPSRQRPLDLAELPDLLHRLGAHLTDDETRRLSTRLRRSAPSDRTEPERDRGGSGSRRDVGPPHRHPAGVHRPATSAQRPRHTAARTSPYVTART